MACRRSFYIDAVRSADYSDLGLGEEEPDSNGGQRRRVGIDEAYPETVCVSVCPPCLDLSSDQDAKTKAP